MHNVVVPPPHGDVCPHTNNKFHRSLLSCSKRSCNWCVKNKKGCLVTFFTNFLALMIKAEVADERSASSAIYAVVLITVNVLFFLSIWWNSWATITAIFSKRSFQVRSCRLGLFTNFDEANHLHQSTGDRMNIRFAVQICCQRTKDSLFGEIMLHVSRRHDIQ